MTTFNPHLGEKIVYDQKFRGYWIVDKPSDINDDLREQILDYIALTKYRQGCKVVTNGYVNSTLTIDSEESRNDEYSEEITDYYDENESERDDYYEEQLALSSPIPMEEIL